ALAAATYATAFFLPVHALGLGNKDYIFYGWEAYQAVGPHASWNRPFGWERILSWVQWLPNPLMWVGIVLLALWRGLSAAGVGLLALAAGVSCAFEFETFRFYFHEYREGYYCWLASMVLLTVAGAWFGLRPLLKSSSPAP